MASFCLQGTYDAVGVQVVLKAEGSIDITRLKEEDKQRLGITSEMASTDINKLLKVCAQSAQLVQSYCGFCTSFVRFRLHSYSNSYSY